MTAQEYALPIIREVVAEDDLDWNHLKFLEALVAMMVTEHLDAVSV